MTQKTAPRKPTLKRTARTLDAAELRRRTLAGEDLLLVDVMPPSQYLLLHIPGAINIPLEYLHDLLEYLPHDKDIILYCTNYECDFAEVAARKLGLHGFTNVLVLSGGMAEWEKGGYEFATVLLTPDLEHEHEHAGGPREGGEQEAVRLAGPPETEEPAT